MAVALLARTVVGTIANPLIGALVDRVSRQRCMVWGAALAGLASAGAAPAGGVLPAVVALVTLATLVSAAFRTAQSAIVARTRGRPSRPDRGERAVQRDLWTDLWLQVAAPSSGASGGAIRLCSSGAGGLWVVWCAGAGLGEVLPAVRVSSGAGGVRGVWGCAEWRPVLRGVRPGAGGWARSVGVGGAAAAGAGVGASGDVGVVRGSGGFHDVVGGA